MGAEMILLILVGVVVLVIGKVKVTRRFSLTGRQARLYGLSLIVLALPIAIVSRSIVPPLLSIVKVDTPIGYRLANLVVLAISFIVPALVIKSTVPQKNESDDESRTPSPDEKEDPYRQPNIQ